MINELNPTYFAEPLIKNSVIIRLKETDSIPRHFYLCLFSPLIQF